MNRMGKRFVALVVIFVSIISFLPIKLGLNGQAANAITTQIQVSGKPTLTGDNVTITNGEYITQQPYENFTLSVDDKIIDNINNISIGQTGVMAQEVIIKAIDGIKLDGVDLSANNAKLAEIGCSISDGDILYTDNSGNKKIGATITSLPFGVNKVEYQIKETTIFNKGKTVTDATGKTTIVDDLQPEVVNYFPSSATTQEIIIQHANGFVQGKISPMVFDAYAGDTIAVYNATKDSKDNKVPFLFSKSQEFDPICPLRYNFNVSDAIQTLKYTMIFNGINIGDTKVIKNGVDDTSNIGIDASNNSISGYLTNLGSSDLIVAKIRDNQTNVVKTYAIQLKYTTLSSSNDYTLRNPGITKLNYDADSTVEAYIDKKFDVTYDNNVITYNGTITLDKRAGMINMQPIIGRQASETAYKITNHYDSGGGIEGSKLINGKQYVNFAKGSTNNEIWLEVYPGKDGNATGAVPLAIYKLKVNVIGSSDSIVNFLFPDSILTQPGRTTSDGIDFDPNRRTYDLYFKQDGSNNVSVTLDKPVTYDIDNNRREYIKAWGGTSVQSDNVTEITDLGKDATANIDITNYKKILLQAYYDQIVYKKDTDGTITSEVESITPYPIGQKYTFYIAKNAGTPDSGSVATSSDASLSNIIAGNGNIKATDGTSGFSSDKANYTVTVPKADTSSKITVTTKSNVKDISATIVETGDEYGLTSGEGFDFPLNSTGQTNIKIVITAQDGITSKTYNITVNNDTRSASALLKDVITDNGDFTFDSEADPNKIRVDQAINTLKVSPVPENSKSKVTVNGEKFSGTPITVDLNGSQETDMEIVVISEDGSNSKTYSFEIYRTDSPLDNDNNTNENDVFYDDIDDCWVDTSKYEEWGKVNGKDIYFNNKGRQVKDQWINTKGNWYYLNSKGYKTSGWRKDVGGKSYYLDPTTGQLKTGWMNQNNKWYYLGLNGVMHKAWLYLNGKWYYFTPEGELVTNQSMFVDDKVYNFAQDGSIY
ncbi:MAG: cadherin-like beta sandwich domain-containing protein [Clostridium sp.]|uniref:N-acetylmuramoyl-L-alanine amidase family protein n=1 Tax=Clostridium sp. TaxID=1506 RepID=UPI0025BA4BF8|nr:cadherin-like beta sandwich domain-containing protein [Clostridium sp.]MCE5222193.1 cadherin-like beta sandwich domain-containing protein [Clostridium sp.]